MSIKSFFPKLLKRLLIVLASIIVLVLLSNQIIFYKSIPSELSEANWSGTWTSEEYDFISGKVITFIPENSSKFSTQALIYYNIWSLYRPCQTMLLDVEGELSDQDLNGHNKRKVQSFKAKLFLGLGHISYEGEISENKNVISGKYLSNSPSDEGTFKISK